MCQSEKYNKGAEREEAREKENKNGKKCSKSVMAWERKSIAMAKSKECKNKNHN